jgi:hypothetical protein
MLDFNDLKVYEWLIRESKPFGVDPSSSIESEDFFRNLLKSYEGEYDEVSVSSWLKEQITQHFVAVDERPQWIQGSEWPIIDGKPMIFAHQVDLPVKNDIVADLFHDDTTLYIFIDSQNPMVIVTQQF